MSYDVYLTETFQKSIKALKKKYRHIKEDLLEKIRALEKDPTTGDPIPGWNKEIWKVKVASSDVKKGKRGGFRLIYLWKGGSVNLSLEGRRNEDLSPGRLLQGRENRNHQERDRELAQKA
ncbi:MAG: type II toxin-antitoxin system RelE/ParE family toxin [Deltaproteobacteria bacterium]|nr:type II toxin-antitoxin system RelE/ParE family toxin [Deltaproteobacteria bacterium]